MFKHIFIILLLHCIMSYPRNIPIDDTEMLHFYMDQYNDTMNRIQHAYRNLDQINENISRLYLNIARTPPSSRHLPRRTRTSLSANYFSPLRPQFRYADTYDNLNTNLNTNTNTNMNSDTNESQFQNIISNFLSSIPIIPSASQLLQATRLVQYRSIANPLNESCPISLERFYDDEFVTQIIFCGHIFNTMQIHIWFEGNVRCPVCRYDIRNHHHHSSNQEEQKEQEQEQDEEEEEVEEGVEEEQREEEEQKEQEPSNSVLSRIFPSNSQTIQRMTEQLLNNYIQQESDPNRFYYDLSNNIFLFEATLFYQDSHPNSTPRSDPDPNI